MEGLMLSSLILLWVVVLINLALTLRVIRWMRNMSDERARHIRGLEELPLGAPAPEFRTTTLEGQPVRLGDYAGKRVALVFSSPTCSRCRAEMPKLVKLAPLARKNGGVEIVVVTDASAADTQAWLDMLRREDGLDVSLPVLVASNESSFWKAYTRGGIPYFCLIDEEGLVRARSLLVEHSWSRLKQTWEGVTELAPWMARQM